MYFSRTDIKAPEIYDCPGHVTLDNSEHEGFAVATLQPRNVNDNDRGSSVRQTMEVTMPGKNFEYH